MAKEKLQEYPVLIDASLDLEATREYFGTGSCNYALSETSLDKDRKVVYLRQQREGNKMIDTSAGFKRICEHGVVVCGYRVNPTGFFKFLKSPKIRIIPEAEKQSIESEIVKRLGNKPSFVEFW